MFNSAINGTGALRILSSGNVFANARIYNNQIGSGKGTFGQFEPGMLRSQALQQGVLVGVGVVGNNAALANGQSFRTNIGFFNPNDTPTTIDAELRDTNGNVVATQMFTLGAWTQTQLPLTNAGGLFAGVTGDIATSSVYFLSGNPIFAYASEIDNISGDANTTKLYPGGRAPVDPLISNPYSNFGLSISSISTTLVSVSAPGSCSLQDFSIQQLDASAYPVIAPAGVQNATLSSLIQRAHTNWTAQQVSKALPQLKLINRPVNQDGCKNSTISFHYVASAGKA